MFYLRLTSCVGVYASLCAIARERHYKSVYPLFTLACLETYAYYIWESIHTSAPHKCAPQPPTPFFKLCLRCGRRCFAFSLCACLLVSMCPMRLSYLSPIRMWTCLEQCDLAARVCHYFARAWTRKGNLHALFLSTLLQGKYLHRCFSPLAKICAYIHSQSHSRACILARCFHALARNAKSLRLYLTKQNSLSV